MERANAVWRASMDAHDDAWPAMMAALEKAEKFSERTDCKKHHSDKDYDRSFEVEGRLKCALAVVEAAEKRATAGRTAVQAAIALLQRLFDILSEREKAGKAIDGDSDAYSDLRDDAQISITRAV